jgi:predicted transcriptional regulator
LQKYLAEMSGASLICFEDETQCYALTSKGERFLEAYRRYSKTNRQAEKIFYKVNSNKQALEQLINQ